LHSNNDEKEIPDSKIISVMQKLDGSFDNQLEEYNNKQLIDKNFNIADNHLLSYILQISNALYYLYQDGLEFNHRDFKPDNTMFVITEKNKIKIDIKQITFDFPSYGQLHKIIDFGLSCIKYKEYNLNTVSYYSKEDNCYRKSRDLSQLVFSILNYHWNILSEKLIGYLGYLLEYDENCKLWNNSLAEIDNNLEENTSNNNQNNNSYEEDSEEENELLESNEENELQESNEENNEFMQNLNNNTNSNNENGDFYAKCAKVKEWNTRMYNFFNREDYDNKKLYPLSIIKDIYNYSKTDILPQSKEAVKFFNELKNDNNSK